MATSFTFSSFLIRFLFALVLVMLTFNPSGFSFYHAIVQQVFIIPVLALAGIVLFIGWVIYLRATLRSLGAIGVILSSALFGCITWIAIYYEWITMGSTIFIYIILIITSAVLGIGMSWSHVRRRLSGQADMDDVDQ